MTSASYESCKVIGENLRSVIGDLLTAGRPFGSASWFESLQTLSGHLESGDFGVVVAGEFKRGKSTLINALLGGDVLPRRVLPCTGVICEVRWGDKPSAMVYGSGRSKRQESIPLDRLAEFVTINTEDREREPAYDRARIFYPASICKDGVYIVDSPGLNESQRRDQITADYMASADAVVVVLDATSPVSIIEQNFITAHVTSADSFFVVNKVNLVDPPDELQSVMRWISQSLRECLYQDGAVPAGPPKLYMVDAKSALDARVSGRDEAYENSGVASLERDLEEFLVRQRARLRLVAGTKVVKQAIYSMRETLPTRRALLEHSRDDLEKKASAVDGPLADLHGRSAAIDAACQQLIRDVSATIEMAASEMINSIASQIPEWVRDYKPSGVRSSLRDAAAVRERVLLAELGTHVQARLRGPMEEWKKTALSHIGDENRKAAALISADLAAFTDALDRVMAMVRDIPGKAGKPPAAQERSTDLSFALQLDEGVQLVNLEPASSGPSTAGAALKALGYVGTFLTPWFPPVGIPVAVIGLGGAYLTGRTKKLQATAGEQMGAAMRKTAKDESRRLAEAAVQPLETRRAQLNAQLNDALESVRAELKRALAAKEQGEAEVGRQLTEIDQVSRKIDDLDCVLDGIVSLLVEL